MFGEAVKYVGSIQFDQQVEICSISLSTEHRKLEGEMLENVNFKC